MNRTPALFHMLLLIAISGLLYFAGLGALGLTDRDEGSNAEAAREMVETGKWMSPTLNYEPRFAKPAFTYWVMSTAYLLFGVNEFSARLHAALFGLLLVLLQYLFVTRTQDRWIGLAAALMLALNIEMVAINRMALTDSVLIFFTTLSLFGFWLGLYGEGRTRRAIWLFYIGMAFATLTKGPVGLLVPLVAAGAFLTAARRWVDYRAHGHPIAGLILTASLAFPWYAGMLWLHGSNYTTSAQADTVGRFLNPIGGHGGTVFFYLPVLLLGFFPWSGWFVFSFIQNLKRWWTQRRTYSDRAGDGDTSESPPSLESFAAWWCLSIVIFFSLSATRLPHYIGPVLPAAAILAAGLWRRSLDQVESPGARGALHLTTLIGYLLAIGLASAPYVYETFVSQVEKEFPQAGMTTPGLGPVAAGVVLLLGTSLAGYFGRSETRRAGMFWVMACSIGAVILILLHVTGPRFQQFFLGPPQQLATIAGLNLGPNDRFVTYGPHKPSWIFYARRKTIVIRPGEEDKLKPYLTLPGRTIILLPTRLKSKLPPETESYEVLLAHGGYSLLANEAMVKVPPRPQESEPRRVPPGH
ncbi:MAG: ArnT family glycosyltransferase [Nitrospiraceae bacterium]